MNKSVGATFLLLKTTESQEDPDKKRNYLFPLRNSPIFNNSITNTDDAFSRHFLKTVEQILRINFSTNPLEQFTSSWKVLISWDFELVLLRGCVNFYAMLRMVAMAKITTFIVVELEAAAFSICVGVLNSRLQ